MEKSQKNDVKKQGHLRASFMYTPLDQVAKYHELSKAVKRVQIILQ